MSFLRLEDFAKVVGVKYGTLRQHLARKKLVKINGFINTDDPKNLPYIKKQTNGKGLDFSKLPDYDPRFELNQKELLNFLGGLKLKLSDLEQQISDFEDRIKK